MSIEWIAWLKVEGRAVVAGFLARSESSHGLINSSAISR